MCSRVWAAECGQRGVDKGVQAGVLYVLACMCAISICSTLSTPSLARRSEEEADRRLMARLRERASHLDSQLAALKLAEAAGGKGVKLKASNLSSTMRVQYGAGTGHIDAPDLLR